MIKQAAGACTLFTVALTPAALPTAKEKSEEAEQKAVPVVRERDNSLEAAATSIPAFSSIPSVTEDRGVSSTPDIAARRRTTANGTPVSAGRAPSGNGGGTTQASWAAAPGGGRFPGADLAAGCGWWGLLRGWGGQRVAHRRVPRPRGRRRGQ
ncbi:hypothetical protein [Actinosynnema pretiosum]|uniref:Uncharacterized protein n=1 Tax=Actinosynnema pretiosum TaxID=42197 RepID=A0A290ZBE0_9PSEU|nr:hypothetical protein [Actinosynnema pretiosum]ATE56299.1 hypothetical protein CNX65_26015 [Actinosynnema pretiosum]